MDFDWVDGVMNIYTCERKDTVLFAPPGSQYDFFTDMHNILKVMNMGPVKTLSHHRLELLEQKFNLHCMLNADKEYLAQKVRGLLRSAESLYLLPMKLVVTAHG